VYVWAGYGYCPSHCRWYWGAKLLLICTCDGTVTGFGLANPKLYGEREQARQILEHQPANRAAPGPAVVTDWLRQRVEAIIWALKHQLGLEYHGGRVSAGLWARVLQRLLALNACIWHNWMIGAPVKRSLIAYDQ